MQQYPRQNGAGTVAQGDGVVIALLEQLARPVACFVFSAEILRPPHPFVARGRQAIFVRNLISHAFPYRVREGAGSPRQSRNSSDWPMPRISVFVDQREGNLRDKAIGGACLKPV